METAVHPVSAPHIALRSQTKTLDSESGSVMWTHNPNQGNRHGRGREFELFVLFQFLFELIFSVSLPEAQMAQ